MCTNIWVIIWYKYHGLHGPYGTDPSIFNIVPASLLVAHVCLTDWKYSERHLPVCILPSSLYGLDRISGDWIFRSQLSGRFQPDIMEIKLSLEIMHPDRPVRQNFDVPDPPFSLYRIWSFGSLIAALVQPNTMWLESHFSSTNKVILCSVRQNMQEG